LTTEAVDHASKSIKYSESVAIASVIQHAKHMHCILLSTVVCLAVPHFFKLSYKLAQFLEEKIC